MPRVFISDKLEAGGVEMLEHAGLEVDNHPGLKDAELQEAMRAADGMVVRSGTRVTSQLLENPGRLRAIVRAGVGVDNIDVPAATRKGIVVMNTPGGNTVSTAELTISHLMSLARHLPEADATMRQGKWERSKLTGTQLAGKTLGIEAAADLDSLLPRCDFLTVHTPLTAETTDLIGARQLARMRKGSRVINCARGGIINEAALAEALKSGHIAGAALDVFVDEPPSADHPLLKLPNVELTPHLGASTTEAQESVALEAAQLLIDFLTRGVIQFAVNVAPVDRAELQEIRLYVDLARRLGLLHAQMCQGSIKRAELHYRGEVARRSTRLITAAFAAGLLEYRLAEQVNIVNAELLARERGIDIVEQISPKKGDFSTLVHAEVVTDKKSYIAAGTLFGNQFLRVVQIGPYRLDTYIDGILLVFTHRDVPGLIGYIGTIFGKHQVNIAQMTVGRQLPGGEAIAVLNLDSDPPEEALKEVRSHPQISSLSVVKLPPAGEMPAWF